MNDISDILFNFSIFLYRLYTMDIHAKIATVLSGNNEILKSENLGRKKQLL